jgi:hypothetical protein
LQSEPDLAQIIKVWLKLPGLRRTKDDIVQFLVYNQPAGLNPNVYESPNTTKERSKQ